MRSYLHRLTVCCLVAIYGLVGLTGESLQYLADDACVWLTNPSTPLANTGYYHSHGPGSHRHFHRHSPGTTADVAQDAEHASYPGDSYRSHRAGHLDHDCPLLSVLSTLKLGHSLLATWQIDFVECLNDVAEPQVLRDDLAPRRALARGPPPLFVA